MTIVQKLSLAKKDATSDKVYHLNLEEVDGGYNVNVEYGKRGSKLTPKCKNAKPLSLEAAQKEFNKIVKSKISDNYTDDLSGVAVQSKELEERVTGITLQLLNKIVDAEKYINDDNYMMQEKYDGRRRAIRLRKGVVTSINKKGLEVLSPDEVVFPIVELNKDITVDGELVGNKYYIFDIIDYEGNDIRSFSAVKRYEILKSTGLPNIVNTHFTKEEKRKAFDEMSKKDNKKEGVVYKEINSSYIGGRPNSGGDQLKCKFYATDTFEVISHNDTKRSINVVSYTEDGSSYDMGRITIPETTVMPSLGDFVEIRYLYCHEGGKLFQTTYLNVRDDQDKSDCHMREIKFKSNIDEDED